MESSGIEWNQMKPNETRWNSFDPNENGTEQN